MNIVYFYVGYVLSVMGRRRSLPNINSPDWAVRMQAERQAVNFVVQGRNTDANYLLPLTFSKRYVLYHTCMQMLKHKTYPRHN